MTTVMTTPQGSPFRLVRYDQDDPGIPTEWLARLGRSTDGPALDRWPGSWLVTASAYGKLLGYLQAYVDVDRVVILRLEQAPQAGAEPDTVPHLVEAALDWAGLPWASVDVAVDSVALPYLLSRGWLPTELVRDAQRPGAGEHRQPVAAEHRAARRLVLSGERVP